MFFDIGAAEMDSRQRPGQCIDDVGSTISGGNRLRIMLVMIILSKKKVLSKARTSELEDGYLSQILAVK